MIACRVLAFIRAKKKSKDWSLSGVLDHLSRVHAVQIADEWMLAEVAGKTRKMCETMSISLNLDPNLIPKR
jgi:hypothetical protein